MLVSLLCGAPASGFAAGRECGGRERPDRSDGLAVSAESPLFTFGVVTDVHYSNVKETWAARRYAESGEKLRGGRRGVQPRACRFRGVAGRYDRRRYRELCGDPADSGGLRGPCLQKSWGTTIIWVRTVPKSSGACWRNSAFPNPISPWCGTGIGCCSSTATIFRSTPVQRSRRSTQRRPLFSTR